MKNSKLLIVLLSVLLCVSCGGEKKERVQIKLEYTEEGYTLKNGTPCVIIRGGSHSGLVGITCNYGT